MKSLLSSIFKARSRLVVMSAIIIVGFHVSSVSTDQLPPKFPSDGLKVVEQGYISQQGEEQALLIVDHIGAYLPRGREQVGLLKEVADGLGARIVASYRSELFFLHAPQGRDDLDALFSLAAEMREKLDSDGVKIGLAYASPLKDAVPYISTDEIIAGVRDSELTDQLVNQLDELGLDLLTTNPFVPGQAVFRVRDPKTLDLVRLSNEILQQGLASYVYPNFIALSYDTETLLNDNLFNNQWHHRNTAQSGGTADADADLSMAWDITLGAAGTVLAIHENGGFDTTHPDLTPNIWTNAGETAGDGVDNDGNGWVDDTLGWDFQGCTAATSPGCGDNSPAPSAATENHGTAVAGVAAAAGGNALGVSGSCPQCSLMLLRSGYVANDFAKSLPFSYAQAMGATVVSNSWGSGNAYPNTTAAINAAATAGVTILFASGNTAANNCADTRVGNDASVIAVSSSTNQDRKVVVSSTGNCVDVLSPSHRGYTAADPLTGTLNITTTDRQGTNGYNNNSPVANCPTAEAGTPPANARDYTACFGGTSSATPLTAGVVGLVQTVNGTITRQQIQNLLQDTTDRVEDSAGAYSEVNGFSAAVGVPTHSNGRLNAFEAVRVAAPVPMGGRGSVDVMIRDNRLDWGNTERPSNTLFEATRGFIPHWRSVDIKVDAPPHAAVAPTTHAQFEAFVDEDPVESSINKVYVRVRNRGPVSADSVTVKLHWAFAGTALPPVPPDFWTAFPADSADTTIWHPTPAQVITNLAYSGASVAGTAGDAAQVLTFDFDAPAVDPTVAKPRHYCVLVVLDSPQDPHNESNLVVDVATPNNNNVTHRNLSLQDSDADSFSDSLYVRNPYRETIRTMLVAETSKGFRVKTEGVEIGQPFSLKAGAEELMRYSIKPEHAGLKGEVSFVQFNMSHRNPQIMGGFTVKFSPRKGK
ncbi:MAG: S8 family serine peptidase, partial [Xanthomonadales bacterium]|nr:S8 family serine peptidase [Xanthomonadales bacterium]